MTRLELVELMRGLEVGKIGKLLVCEAEGDIDELLEVIARRNIKRGYIDCMKWLNESRENLELLESAISRCIIDNVKNFDLVEYIEATQIEANQKELAKNRNNIIQYYALDWLINIKQVETVKDWKMYLVLGATMSARTLEELKEMLNFVAR